MMDFGQQQELIVSISHGDVLPAYVLKAVSLPEILHRATSKATGIIVCDRHHREDFQSYQNLLEEAEIILGSLRKYGLKPQDKVILQLQNPRYFFASLWGCFLGGFVPIPLGVDWHRDLTKLYQAWNLCESSLVICDSDLENSDLAVVKVEELLNSQPDNNWHCGKLDDLALLLFTSGSTGQPKAVMLSVRNLLASVYGMANVNQLSEQDITLNWMPLEHVASLVMFHLTEVYLGCQQIQVKNELIVQNPLQWLNLIHKYRVTATWSPNFAYNLVNGKLEKIQQQDWDLSCVRWIGNGAEAVVGKTTRRFLELLAAYGLASTAVSPGYGMSETSSGICHSNSFNLKTNDKFVEVGAPIPGVSLRIANQENEVVPEGTVGLLQVKGETVTKGYYQQPELNKDVFTADGWFNTGDLGFLKQGRLTITGRQKDVIIINGINYYNRDIETIVESLAGVTIAYTAACGVKDSNQQEQIAIFLHTQEQEPNKLRELINKIRKTVFTEIGVAPTYIIPVAKANIPKTAIGKIQRQQLSQRFAIGEFDSVIEKIASLWKNRNLTQQELPNNAIELRVAEVWREVLNLETVSVNDNFFELGGNSLLLMQVLSELTREYQHLSAVTLFQYPTIATLASYLESDRKPEAVQQGKRRGELRRKATNNQDIAIIGMSCRFPGANNIEQFWDNLCNGVESISFFDEGEILDSGVDAELSNNPNYVKASPILDNIENFDANFWGYSPKEAQLLDPQQRLFLECAWESLEDAGYDPLDYTRVISLYGGAATNTYLLNHIYPNRSTLDDRDPLQVINLSSMGGFQVTTANDKDYLTTRTSYKLNLTGSSVNIQTACSTSLVAVHLACQSLLNSECDLALAGGVSVHTPQKMGYLYQEGMILSPDGHCRTFDAQAAGTIFGNGAGIVVLKLLDKAIQDGDRIYGVIKGSAVNNDGATKVGYLAPNVDGQTRVIAEALAVADIPPQSISYIEAHGTGTKLGDPIEFAALTQAYQTGKGDGNCGIGSVKTNVGHLQIASGIVGLIKTLLCLDRQKIPPSLHFSQPNPQIDFDRSPFYINTQLQDWKTNNYPRRAGVNSLGIGGTNAHLILEEFITKKETTCKQLPAYLLTLSAKTKTALAELITSYRNYLIKHPDCNLADICLTSNIGRHHFEYRQAIVVSSQIELAEKLSVLSPVNIVQENNKIAFLFTGQGSQYIGMGKQLYETQPLFRDNIHKCAEILNQDYIIRAILDQSIELEIDINQTEYTQPLLFTIEYSIAQLWLSWGIKPDVVMGHSLGEYVAACIAGIMSLEAALKLVAHRGKLMQTLPKNGAMLAVFTNKEKIDYLLNKDVTIAADNGSHLVLSGLKDAIASIAQKLNLLAIKNQYLKVSHAFHSPLMQQIVKEFKAVAETINYSLPQIPIVSNLTGKLADETIATADYWVNHILQPVQFAKSIQFLDRQQVNIFLEIGTKPTLIGMARSILDNKIFLSTLNPQQPDWQQILSSLAQLYIAGININWLAVAKNYNGRKISLPTYPFQRQRYWFDLPQKVVRDRVIYKSDLDTQDNIHPLLGNVISSPLKQTIFQSYLQLDIINWLQDHCLNNQPVFPGMAYLEIAIALGLFHNQSNQLVIEDVNIHSPLYLKSNSTPKIQTITYSLIPSINWEIYSQKDREWQLHCSGKVSLLNLSVKAQSLPEIKTKFINSELDVKQHYLSCRQKGINYGKSFQGIKQLWAKDNQALGLIERSSHFHSNKYHFHPALLDSCLQILLAAVPTTLQTTIYIPIGIKKLELYTVPKDKIWSYLSLKKDNHSDNKILTADVWLYSDRGELIAKIEGLKSQAINTQPNWHNWLYQQQWKPQPLLKNLSLTSKPLTWLIFADDRGIGKQLVTLLESQHHQCYLVVSQQNNLAKDREIVVNPDDPQALLNLIEQHPEVEGIIYLWSLDFTENWQEWKSYLYLVQAIVKQQLPHKPRLWFITRNAQPVGNYHLTLGIRQSCLWGMQKAIALEHPELSCVGIDLDPNLGNNEAEKIFQEICVAEIEQVAFRNNQRYVARLVKSKAIDPHDIGRGREDSISKAESYLINPQRQDNLNNSQFNLQLQISHAGNLDSLRWKPVTRHQPQDNEIEIEVKATGLNFRDLMVALDLYPDDSQFLGLECTGVVTAIGKEVTDFQIGDPVIAIASHCFSQYLTVNSLLAIPKPKSLSFAQAATISIAFLTAYYTLSHLAQLQPGEKILIHAAAGGVGLAAIAIARQIGADIFATASPSKWELLRSMGITNIMNSRSLDFAHEVMSATNGKGVDVVLNSLSGEFIPKSISVLKDRGRFIEIGKQNIWLQNDVLKLKPTINYSIVDLWQITRDRPELIQQMLIHLRSQFATGEFKPLPYTIFTSDKIIDAFRYMQQGKHQGKIIITQNNNHNNLTIPASSSAHLPISQVNFNGTYLITGGLGAIGLQVAQLLATKGIKHLVLMGRRQVKPELENKLKKIQDNAQATIIKADVADTNQLDRALKQIESTLPPLRGVVHCAGVIDDRVITKQDENSFNKVLPPKVRGAWNLHHLTQKYDLKSFILFSSASSLLGSPGQVNYCAANAFLDVLAHGRHSQGLPAIAINWGAWQNTGLASNTQTIKSLQQKGLRAIALNQGREILEQLLSSSQAQIGVIPIDWNKWSQSNFVTPFYENIFASNNYSVTDSDWKKQLLAAIPDQRRSLLIEQITQQLANILGIKEPNKIALDLGFSELGLDSLGSVELRNKLQFSYDIKLAASVIFDYSNIQELADYLLTIIFKNYSPSKTIKTETNNFNLTQINNLSEVEAEALLLEELNKFNF